MSTPKWRRYRFKANYDDSRPVKFPPPGPWWESGFGDDYSIVVAYLPARVDPKKYWPEASEITFTDETEIHFSGRFPRPDWWKGEGKEA